MDFTKLSQQIKAGKYNDTLFKSLSVNVKNTLLSLPETKIENKLRQIAQPPIMLHDELEQSLHQFRFSAAWLNIFEEMNLPRDTALMEIAAGDTIYIAQALDAYAGERGRYVSFNLNKKLTNNFYKKAALLRSGVRIVEDNALNASHYFGEESFDAIAFHHAVNDIIQTIVAGVEGIDTVNSDWWVTEPEMLRAVMKHHNLGTLKEVAYQDFIRIIDVCGRLLKKGGCMIFDNCTFAADFDGLGYSMEFHSAYIDLARQWIKEADRGLSEITIGGYDPKWWMIFRK